MSEYGWLLAVGGRVSTGWLVCCQVRGFYCSETMLELVKTG